MTEPTPERMGACTVLRVGRAARIVRADPRIWISREMVEEIERGWGSHYVTLTDDDVLTLRGDNRTVVYRIDRDRYNYEQDSYYAEWPD